MDEDTGRLRRAESFTFIPRSHMVDRPLSLLTRRRSLPDVTPVIKYEPRCSFPTVLFRRNWDIINDHFRFGPYISTPFGRSSLHDPFYGSAYRQPAIWTYYTPPSTHVSTPRRYYDYDHKMGALNATYLPRYVYYPAYTYNMDYYFGSTPKDDEPQKKKPQDPKPVQNGTGKSKKRRSQSPVVRSLAETEQPARRVTPRPDPRWPDPPKQMPLRPANLIPANLSPELTRSLFDTYYSKPYRTWKTDHLSDEIERNYRSYDREPYSSLDSYRLSNDLYWERRFKNYSSRQQYTWSRDRSLLPAKLSSYDQWHVYGGFRPRRESFNMQIPGQSSAPIRSPSLSAVHVSI